MKVCTVCRLGRLMPDHVPYLHMWKGQIMVIPHVPALVCDNCQHTEHDPAFMNQVESLISYESVKETTTVEDRPHFYYSQFGSMGAV